MQSTLQTGNIVYFRRFRGSGGSGVHYKHFAIVTNLFPDEDKIEIIHLNQPGTRRNGNGKEVYDCMCSACSAVNGGIEGNTNGFIVNLQKIDKDCVSIAPDRKNGKLSSFDTVQNARSHLHETKYNLVSYNCEHFAYLCSTKKASSAQVGWTGVGISALGWAGMVAATGVATGGIATAAGLIVYLGGVVVQQKGLFG